MLIVKSIYHLQAILPVFRQKENRVSYRTMITYNL